MLKLKMPELRQDLTVSLKMFHPAFNGLEGTVLLQMIEGCMERWLDAKNFQLSLLLDEMDEFETQLNLTSQCHVGVLDRLFGKQFLLGLSAMC